MELTTQSIWRSLGDELFFFILKRVKSEEAAKEILQESFLKIHKSLPQLREDSKVRAWSYQIVRNEIANFHNKLTLPEDRSSSTPEIWEAGLSADSYCCFERFIGDLPEKYHQMIEEVYLKGNTQIEAAEKLGISLANAKARVRRAKEILKQNFQDCCKYQLDKQGMLTGDPDCDSCA